MNAQTKTKVNGNPEAHAEAAAKANAKRAERKANLEAERVAEENVKRRDKARAEAEAEAEAESDSLVKAEDKAELMSLINQPRTKAEIKGWLLFKGYTAKVAMAILEEYMPKAEKAERTKSLRDKLWAHCSTAIMSDDIFNILMMSGTENEIKHRKTFDNERLMFNKIHSSYRK